MDDQISLCYLMSVKIIISHDFDNMTSAKGSKDDKDISTYTLDFLNGWKPPEVSASPEPREPARRLESPRPTASQVTLDIKPSLGQAEKWRPAHPPYNARYAQELKVGIHVSVFTCFWRPLMCFSVQWSQSSSSCVSYMTSLQETTKSSPSEKEKQWRQVSFTWTNSLICSFLPLTHIPVSVLRPPTAAGQVEAVVEGQEPYGGGGLCSQ